MFVYSSEIHVVLLFSGLSRNPTKHHGVYTGPAAGHVGAPSDAMDGFGTKFPISNYDFGGFEK